MEAWVGGPSLGYTMSKDGLFMIITGYLETVRSKYKGNLSSWLYEKDQGKKNQRINFELGEEVNMELAFANPLAPQDLEELKKQSIEAYTKSK
jgi:hypothetical protein